jgi:hypothetical protein
VDAINPGLEQVKHSQVRILTHALPVQLPSYQGHVFSTLIPAINQRFVPTETQWISHWHAVSGQFSLADLPTSPPSTPAAPGEGDDYFTTRIFDSAVAVPDYQTPVSRLLMSQSSSASVLRRGRTNMSPKPVLPPGTLDVSITERYIPPASASEFAGLFDAAAGPSLLSDRIVELNEKRGHLIFIYPTRRGAETFMRDYLGKVLDPLLRQMMVINRLTAGICEEVGRMSAISEMFGYEELQARLTAYCRSISSSDESNGMSRKFQPLENKKVQYEVVFSGKAEAKLDAAVWSEWWCRQEKPRIRDIFESWVRREPGRAQSSSTYGENVMGMQSQRMASDHGSLTGGSMSLLMAVLDGVKKAAKEKELDERPGVETGIFVIRKSIEGQASRLGE